MPTSERADLSKVLPAVKCTARKRNGEPCKAMAARGANVCRVHGGSAPQVKKAARRRLDNAADALVQKLLGFALDGDTGVPPAVALAAIRDALDRAGMSAKTSVEVEIGPKPFEQIFTHLEIGSRAAYRASVGDDVDGQPDPLAGLPALGSAHPETGDDDDIVDAVVVDVSDDDQPHTHGQTERQRDARTAAGFRTPDDDVADSMTWVVGDAVPPADGLMTMEAANEVVAQMRAREARRRIEEARESGHATIHPVRRALPPGRSGRGSRTLTVK